jgi:pyruvate/2-oxoglutarate dehydrogenase complex dihydrolipoamide dehydrogenase (E3) component
VASFDVIVIGAGPAGEVAAGDLAARGYEVAVAESEFVGGECAFYACMPSKALLRPAETLAETERVPGAAEAVSGRLDVAAALARRDEVIHDLDDAGQAQWLEDRGITLLRGHATIAGEKLVSIAGEGHEARKAVIVAVGSRASMPPIEGLEAARPWTNREVTTAKLLPARLVVIGGGVVGVEMAQAYSELGVRVCVLEAADRLLVGEEDFVGEQIADALRAGGVDVRLGVEISAVERMEGVVAVAIAGATPAVEADELLVAAGRTPRTDGLGLERLGLEAGKPIAVDDAMRVPGHGWLYAIGDVNGRAELTHAGKYQARVAAAVIDGDEARASTDTDSVPRVVFTDPQVAAVGLTLARAREHGLDARAYDVETSATPGASFHGRGTPGTSRLVVDEARGLIVGATFTGTEVAEWLHAATIAITAEVPLARLADAIPAFPTRSEVWLKLLEQRRKDLHETAGPR